MITNMIRCRKVYGIPDNEMRDIEKYLQGMVYSWVKNRKGENFAARDLVGGINFDWSNTPLQVIFDKHKDLGKDPEAAVKAAGIDLGWILKKVLHADKREFQQDKARRTSVYTWVEGT